MLTIIIITLSALSYLLIPPVQDSVNYAVEVFTSNDSNRMEAWVKGFGWFGPLLLICAMVGQMFLLVVPTTALLVVAVLAYGPIWGSAIALLAIFAASSVGYLIGRVFGSVAIEKILGSKAKKKSTEFLEEYGFWAIFITRLNPFLSNDVVSLVSGMLKMGYWKFTLASIAGITPLILFIAIMGENFQNLISVLLISSVAMITIFLVYVVLRGNKTLGT